MRRIAKITLPLAVMALLAGCFDGSNNGGDIRPDPTVEFSTFVKAQIENTDTIVESANINELEFSFNDQNNEQAFDDLFLQ
jgi:hypothetical protein